MNSEARSAGLEKVEAEMAAENLNRTKIIPGAS